MPPIQLKLGRLLHMVFRFILTQNGLSKQANDSSYRAAPSMICGKEEMIGAVKLKFLEQSVGWRDRVRLWVIFFLL